MTADTYRYAPGSRTAVIVWPVGVLVDLPIADLQVAQLYSTLIADPTPEAALDTLAAHGLTHMPSFGIIAMASSQCRLIVRGTVKAILAASGDQVAGSGLFTDTTVPTGSNATILIDGPLTGTDQSPDAAWPLRHGVVSADRLSEDWPPDAVAHPLDQPEPVAKHKREARVVQNTAQDSPTPAHSATSEPEEPASNEPTGFEHLFGQTTRFDDAVDAIETPAPGQPSFATDQQSLGVTQMSPSTMALEAMANFTSEAPTDPPAAAPTPDKAFIDSFDWMPPGANPAPNHLETVPPPPPPPPPPAQEEDLGGHTIKRSSIAPSGDVVVAVRCPSGHLNPPYADRCRVCHAAIAAQQPVQVARPSLGTLKLSSGLTLTLDRGAVLGRNPRPVPGSPGPQPNLVKLNDPNKDISSQHLEVRLEGWLVTVRDLNSTNGTQVILPGQAPVTLRANEPMTIEPGTRVMLAQVFDFLFEAQ